VVYEGAPPNDRLTASIDAGSETEALSRLFEGLGLTYAFKLDAGGRHVETLFVTSSSTRRSSSAMPASASRRPAPPTTEDYDNASAPEEPDPANDPSVSAVVPPNGPETMGVEAGGPGVAGGQIGAVPGVEAQNPAFPSGASLPTPSNPFPGHPGFPVNPGPPAFPGPASYP
jgi:hypothetical protein